MHTTQLTSLLKQTMILENDLTFNDQDATHAHSSTGWPIKVSIQHRAFQSNQLRYLPHWDQLGCLRPQAGLPPQRISFLIHAEESFHFLSRIMVELRQQ